jgi:hypothetical protein
MSAPRTKRRRFVFKCTGLFRDKADPDQGPDQRTPKIDPVSKTASMPAMGHAAFPIRGPGQLPRGFDLNQPTGAETILFARLTNDNGDRCQWRFIMNRHLLAILVGCATQLLATAADARSSYDGSWNIVTRGCSPTYNYSVNIENGVITSPAAETFRGNVTSTGAVRASVTMQESRASGSGKLTGVLGRGTWSGYSGDQRCAGSWTAQRAW